MNQQLHKTRELLAANGYHCIRQTRLVDGDCDDIEMWSGPKGVVILQHVEPQDGVITYADWPLGVKYEEMAAALAKEAVYEPGDPEKLYEQLRDLIHEHGSDTVLGAFNNVTS